MGLAWEAGQPMFGRKSESHNRKRRKTKSTANSFCNIRPKWPPADVLAKVISCRYVVKRQAELLTMFFLKQIPNHPGNWKKKKIQLTKPKQAQAIFYFSFIKPKWTRTSVLRYWTHTRTSSSCIIHNWTLALKKTISKPNSFWMAELP